MSGDRCRGCALPIERVFCDLGALPLANALLAGDRLAEARYPLRPLTCEHCHLVQLPELVAPSAIFAEDYPYFSSQSAAFVEHAGRYADQVIDRFGLGPDSLVVELASNDGYLLQHFVRRGIRCYGVEPARNVAHHAIRRGVPTLIEFFSAILVGDLLVDTGPSGVIVGGKADLIVANNVLAHVPRLESFLQGIRLLLAREGVLTIEVPWLVDLVMQVEVGTIYHEHFSYFLLSAIEHALGLSAVPLRVFDVELLPDIHGGSLRVFACHANAHHVEQPRVAKLRQAEASWLRCDFLDEFAGRAAELKHGVWSFLANERKARRTVAGYCAAAKASTLLAWCGVGPETVPFIADTTPAKQDRYLPGARIPIVHPGRLGESRPDTIWILAPNWAKQILPRLRAECPWGPRVAWQDGTGIVVDEAPAMAQAA